MPGVNQESLWSPAHPLFTDRKVVSKNTRTGQESLWSPCSLSLQHNNVNKSLLTLSKAHKTPLDSYHVMLHVGSVGNYTAVLITEPPFLVDSQWIPRIPGKFPKMSKWVPLVYHPIPTLFLPHSHLIPSAFLVNYLCTTLIVRCQIFMFVYVFHVTYDMKHNIDLVWHHFFSTFQWYTVWHMKTVLSCMAASHWRCV